MDTKMTDFKKYVSIKFSIKIQSKMLKKKIFFIILNLHILKYFSEQMSVVIEGTSHVLHNPQFPALSHSLIWQFISPYLHTIYFFTIIDAAFTL